LGSDNGSDNGAVYTPRQFAAIVGRSVSTLKNWERKGYLTPGRYPSGQRFYTKDHVEQILGETEDDTPDPVDPTESNESLHPQE
jgi:hypothetical protein